MNRHIAVLSTGAIGSSVGADLTKAGYDVTLIDQWPAHVEAMKARGLSVFMPGKELHTPVQAVHISELSFQDQQFDIVYLTAKSFDTCWLVQLIKPYLKPDGVLVSLQNSLNDEWIVPIIGYGRDMGAVVELSAEILGPGRVKRNTDPSRTWFALGELHGRVTPRLREVTQILSAAGVTEIRTNIWGAKWSKLVLNSMLGVGSVLGLKTWELIERPEVFGLCIRLGKESLKVGTTLGYTLEPLAGMSAEDFSNSTDKLVEKMLVTLVSIIGKTRSANLQDQDKGRRTEVDYLNGLIANKGKEAKVATPLNEAVTFLTKEIEQRKRKRDISNLAMLEQLSV